MNQMMSALDTLGSNLKNDVLQVDRRVLIAGSRSIVIANIAHIQLTEDSSVTGKKVSLFIFGGIGLLIGIALMANGSSAAGAAPLLIGGLMILKAIMLKRNFGLAVTTNDGARTSFVGENIELLRYAKDYLTWKINAADETASNVFNFNNSNIVNSQIADRIDNQE